MSIPGPIGVFDSGLGGLSVLHEIRRTLPRAELIYCADHAFLPYGERPPAQVRARALAIGAAFRQAGACAIVIACNTATAAAAEALRARIALPIVGMEPAVKPATAATRAGVVGVLGTGGTLQSARFAALLERFAGNVRVVTRPAPELVAAVERGEAGAPVGAAVRPLVGAGADVIVLGCTHFPFLRAEIATAAGPDVRLIETGPAVARRLAALLPPGRARGAAGVRFWTTGDPALIRPALERLWGASAAVAPAPVASLEVE